MLGDFLSALTNSQLWVGHSQEYLEEPGRRESETFANYVALVGSPSGKIYHALLKNVAPKTISTYDEIIEKQGGRSPA